MNLTFVDCCNKNFIKLVLKNVIKLSKGSLNNIFQDPFNKILSQQLTHDTFYISDMPLKNGQVSRSTHDS